MKGTILALVASAVGFGLGCSAPSAPSPAGPESSHGPSLPGGAQPPAASSPSATSASPAPPSTAAQPSATPSGAPVAQRFAGTQFPPPNFDPPHDQSAKPGDGQWSRLGNPALGDRLGHGPAVMVWTTVHPHPVSRFLTVTVVAMDLRHLAVYFTPGTGDRGVDTLPSSHPAGLVPEAHHEPLLAVFNGGFLPRHGGWGMMVAGKTLVPPRQGACAVGLYRDGAVRIRAWSELAPTQAEMRAWRQTPPCLLEAGRLHPQLEARNERPWGGRDPKRQTRRRTCLGIDPSGRVLLFGMGVEVGPRELAEAMRAAGAVHAAQLDINWSWTRFLLFGRPAADAKLQVTSTLIPKMVHSRMGYVSRSAARDFFYVIRRGD